MDCTDNDDELTMSFHTLRPMIVRVHSVFLYHCLSNAIVSCRRDRVRFGPGGQPANESRGARQLVGSLRMDRKRWLGRPKTGVGRQRTAGRGLRHKYDERLCIH